MRLTALYSEHVTAGATIVERDGWLLPHAYRDPTSEQNTLREAVGLLDISERGKIDLKGNEVDAVLTAVFPNARQVDVGSFAPVGSNHTYVCRLTHDQALLLTTPRALQDTLDQIERAAADLDCAHATDITSTLCGIRLLGPRAPAVLERLSALDLAPDRFGDGALVQGAVAKIHALIRRHDTAGFPGYDLYVDRDLGAYLWDTLLEIGAPLGLQPVGRDAEAELS